MGALDDHKRTEDGLKLAFGEAGGSVLDAIERLSGARSRILLRDGPEEATPVLRIAPEGEKGGATDDSRYQILGEIASGGMGVVYKARDKDLGRDVALKVLRDDLAKDGAVVQRFIEEAQVGGQLQHPGIVPIYGLGLQEGGRPYIAMKLIKGETLTALLEEGRRGSQLITTFELVAQTIAYAHSRGVIHRDLKPSNVMVGAFGEVQVVDWGFAKVLGREEKHPRPGVTMVATVRTGAEGSQSVAGSVMGTPAYMPPEQAMGQIDDLTERSDVFALGAILCEILTGQPPYTGTMPDQLLAAAHARLEEAFERLDGCSAPGALKRLVRDCLAPLPKHRPKDAGALAHRLSEHLASVEARARQAELDAVHAAATARRVRRSRRVTVALASLALVAIVGGGAGYHLWNAGERERARKTAERVVPALREATRCEGEGKWPEALAAATTALALAEAGGTDDSTLAAAREVQSRIEGGARGADALAKKAAREAKLIESLDDIMVRSIDLAPSEREKACAAAFDEFGVNPRDAAASASLLEFGDRIALAVHLDQWARRSRGQPGADWQSLDRLARAIDPDPWRNRLRDAAAAPEVAVLRELASSVDAGAQHPGSLVGLALLLDSMDDGEASAALLQRACTRHPSNFWIQSTLAVSLLNPPLSRPGAALPHAMVAVALRPGSSGAWSMLGAIRSSLKDDEGALRAFEEAMRLDAIGPSARSCYAVFLSKRMGRHEEALAMMRAALAIDPNSAALHSNLGVLLRNNKEYEAGAAACREALRLAPDGYVFMLNLALCLIDLPDAQGALAACRQAIAIAPNQGAAHARLGSVLEKLGEFDNAEAAYREAIRLDPKNAGYRSDFAGVLFARHDLEGAMAELRASIRLDPELVEAYCGLGNVLHDKGKHDAALAAFREAIRLDPGNANPHAGMVLALKAKGDLDGALAAGREALRLKPEQSMKSMTYVVIGETLDARGDVADAIAAFREAIRIDPNRAKTHSQLANALLRGGDSKGALTAYREAIRLDPKSAGVRGNLASLLLEMGEVEGAILQAREAIRLDPGMANLYLQLAMALKARRDVEGAIAACREALRVDANSRDAHVVLGLVFCEILGRYEEAIAEFREALRIDPYDAQAHRGIAVALRMRGDLPAAAAAIREARRLDPENRDASRIQGLLLTELLKERLPAVVRGTKQPADALECLGMAELCEHDGSGEAAVALYRRAFEMDPALAPIHGYAAAQAALLAGPMSHGQALVWLRAALDGLSAVRDGKRVAATLRRWKRTRQLEDVRAEDDLPEEWRKFWADVDARLKAAVK